ncbi:LysO family transporter [Carboxylicivirga linearis]|uniref:LysO family transporter n=1 Tax=Carboxylicivirga linearis TaxID=1628157 RepID=UPI001FD5B13B|nr:LysO family transporter [Carboxylicivirga linearis]
MTSYIVIGLFIAGIFIGRQLKNKEKTRKRVDKAVNYAIYLLLFLLGISVGINEDIIQNFSRIGYKALLLTIGALAGSILLAKVIYIFFFKKYQEKES